jgi:hypothetical protein
MVKKRDLLSSLHDLELAGYRKGSHVLWQTKVADRHLSAPARATVDAGRMAWERIKSSSRQRQSYYDWAQVSQALQIAEDECTKMAGKAQGGAYARLMAAWLRLHDMDDISWAVRSWLREIRKHQTEIDIFRNSMPPEQKMKLNHPRTILQHWKASRPNTPEPTR